MEESTRQPSAADQGQDEIPVELERRRVDRLLKENQKLTQNIIDGSSSLIYSLDLDGKFTLVNESLATLFKIDREQLIGCGRERVLPDDIAVEHRKNDLEVVSKGAAVEFEEHNIQEDGLHVYLSQKFPLFDVEGKVSGVCGISTDITSRKQVEEELLATQAELQRHLVAANQSRRVLLSMLEDQKQAEAALGHANRALACLGAVNRILVHATDEYELLQSICQAIVGQRGYRLAWVGYVQHDERKSIQLMASADHEHEEGCPETAQITWAENELGMGPSGCAVRSGVTQVCQDIASDPSCLPWRAAALQRGHKASISLPLINGNASVFGIFNVYADEAHAFSVGEIDLLEEMAGDLAFGVRTLHVRHERDLALEQSQQHLVQLRDSLEGTVRAIAAVVEMRDPYTSGHQARVAGLAAAIARQMGLPDEQVHAIRLAGMVHDLGKIRIPAEILAKPGKITDIEFSLIKVHPQAGYDILKSIAFPWPIAQMVLQHHERLDGSGYPQGLKGEQIDLGARILSVADVVEAISSHRPYRPALGVEAALNEITRARGTHFEPKVVDACLALFREQGYLFQD